MTTAIWEAGVASTVITPTESMWLAGWAARRQPSIGTSMELFAKALALEDSTGERLVIVTADLIAIPRALATAVALRVGQRWNLPRKRLLFNASHTHTGPEVRPDKVSFFEIPSEFAAKIEPYVVRLEEILAHVIDAALDRLEPVTLYVHQLQAGFAANRSSPSGPTDHDVPVLAARRANGSPLAIVFGYACHNLTLPPTFLEFHGDYAGVAQECVEKNFPGATALFVAGAGADQDPSPRGTLELARAHGRTLAEKIQRGRSRGGREVSGSLRAAFEEVALDLLPLPAIATLQADLRSDDPPRRRKAAYLLAALTENRPLPTSQSLPVQVLRLGNELLLIALGGEPVAEYALRFKGDFAGPVVQDAPPSGRTVSDGPRSGGFLTADESHLPWALGKAPLLPTATTDTPMHPVVWVAGYCNDVFGYLPTRRVQQEGGYEGGRASLWSALPTALAETAEARVADAVHRLVRRASDSSVGSPR